MICTAHSTSNNFRLPKNIWSEVAIQVRGPGSVLISMTQGEAATSKDGVILTQQATERPWVCWFNGDFFYSTNIDPTSFIVLIIGYADRRIP